MWGGEGLNLIEDVQGAVMKAEIADGLGNSPLFDKEGTVSGHTG